MYFLVSLENHILELICLLLIIWIKVLKSEVLMKENLK